MGQKRSLVERSFESFTPLLSAVRLIISFSFAMFLFFFLPLYNAKQCTQASIYIRDGLPFPSREIIQVLPLLFIC